MAGWTRRIGMGVLGLLGFGLVAGAAVTGWAVATVDASMSHPDTPYPALVARTDPETIERGRYLVHGPAHCAQCHSEADRNHPERVLTEPLHGGLEFAMGPIGSMFARNLTPDATTGIGRRTDAELARVLRHGVLPDGTLSVFMRYSAANLSDDDIVAVISYLRSLDPVVNEVPDTRLTVPGKVLVRLFFGGMTPRDAGPVGVQAGAGPDLERGRYLAEEVMLCTACHSEYDQATFERVGPVGGGGVVEASHGDDSDMEFWPPNLTSHPTGVTGRLDEEAFLVRMRAPRAYLSSIMPWENFGQATDDDLRSVYRYLRSLPPVDADKGPSYRPVGWTPEG